MAVVDRETWQQRRDAAGLKKGLIKTSIGDLLDRWHKVMKPVAPKAPERVRTVLKKIAGPANKAELTAIGLALAPAAYEYVEKIKTEKGLAVVKHDTRGDIPVHALWSVYVNNNSPPLHRVVAVLNEMIYSVCLASRNLGFDTQVVKACPPLKAVYDDLKKLEDNKDPLPTREEWRAHRDGAGLPQGYTQASIGDLLEGLRKPLGNLTRGLDTALEALSDANTKAAALAAQKLVFGASQYRAKLIQDTKKFPEQKVRPVMEDLEQMVEVSLAVIGELGHPG